MPIPLDPAAITAYIEVGKEIAGIVGSIIAKLKAGGVSDEQLAAITADYDLRIGRREAESE